MSRPRVHFVTGRLAEHALRKVLAELATRFDFEATVEVLGISVAALMTTSWVARKWTVPSGVSRVILPGYCLGELGPLVESAGVPVERGPKDLRELPEYLTQGEWTPRDLSAFDIRILAEINHAPRISRANLVAEAQRLAADGADWIDIGCDPDGPWLGVADATRALRDLGLRVSIDSMDPREIEPATRAGAELVLSVDSSNRLQAPDWGCEVVAIPDDPSDLDSLDDTIEFLEGARVPFRIDPILSPLGMGFAASLERYLTVRRRYPKLEMLMGIGNVTELTDVDSAGVNVLLLGFCQELGIRSVLTTQVINWARTCVRECEWARRLVHFAVRERTPPKRVDERLVMLRDPKLLAYDAGEFDEWASSIRDRGVRIFAEGERLHVVGRQLHLEGDSPFALFERLLSDRGQEIDSAHAFYLGFEMAKALTALTLGKQYRQDQPLNWGFLTRLEVSGAHGLDAEPE